MLHKGAAKDTVRSAGSWKVHHRTALDATQASHGPSEPVASPLSGWAIWVAECSRVGEFWFPAHKDSSFTTRLVGRGLGNVWNEMFHPPPIVLLGTHRSGTSWLGRLFEACPGTVYWSEPRPVWMRGDPKRDDDAIPADRATPQICDAIREAFQHRVQAAGGGQFCEKTPSNCLRAEFVARVLPEARFVLVVRDGRSVLRSSDEMQGQGINRRRLITRLREVPPWHWPKYVPIALETLGAKLFKRKLSWWGPKPAGWREAMHMSKGARLGWQWSETLRSALDATEQFSQDRVFQFRYEDMMASPKQTMGALVDFCGFDHGQVMIDRAVKEADPTRIDRWRSELDPKVVQDAQPQMEALMDRLGYRFD